MTEAVLTSCARCVQFEKDRIGDGTGIGRCLVNAPESRRLFPPTKVKTVNPITDQLEVHPRYPLGYIREVPLYPDAERWCNQYKAKQ